MFCKENSSWIVILLNTQCHSLFCKVNGKGGLTFSKRYDSTFLTKGFCNWKKGAISVATVTIL